MGGPAVAWLSLEGELEIEWLCEIWMSGASQAPDIHMSEDLWLAMKPDGTTGAIYPPIADGEGIAVDALAPGITEARCKLTYR